VPAFVLEMTKKPRKNDLPDQRDAGRPMSYERATLISTPNCEESPPLFRTRREGLACGSEGRKKRRSCGACGINVRATGPPYTWTQCRKKKKASPIGTDNQPPWAEGRRSLSTNTRRERSSPYPGGRKKNSTEPLATENRKRWGRTGGGTFLSRGGCKKRQSPHYLPGMKKKKKKATREAHRT